MDKPVITQQAIKATADRLTAAYDQERVDNLVMSKVAGAMTERHQVYWQAVQDYIHNKRQEK